MDEQYKVTSQMIIYLGLHMQSAHYELCT